MPPLNQLLLDSEAIFQYAGCPCARSLPQKGAYREPPIRRTAGAGEAPPEPGSLRLASDERRHVHTQTPTDAYAPVCV